MTNPSDFTVCAVGIVCATVCTSLNIEDATRRLNAEHPTGIGPWEPSEDKHFKGGEHNPCPCHDHPETHKHWLFNC